MKFRAFWSAIMAALFVGVLTLIGQPAFASVQVSQTVAGVTASRSPQSSPDLLAYRPFNAANFRYNLVERTQLDPGANCQAHHTIPQKYEMQAGIRGINIHDPIYGLWWVSAPGLPGNHQSMAAQYNSDWDRFFVANPGATQAQILGEQRQLVAAYQKYYRCF